MSTLKDYISEEIVKPHMTNIMHPTKAVVLRLDDTNNRVDILYQDSYKENGITQLFEVPLMLGSGGIHSTGPFVGDEVWVTFGGGDVKRPQITSLVDENFAKKSKETRMKHLRKGSLIPHMTSGRDNW